MQQQQQSSFKEWINGLPVNVATFKTLRKQEEKLRIEVYLNEVYRYGKRPEAAAELKIVGAHLDRLAIAGCDETLASFYGKSGMTYHPAQMRWASSM